MRACLALVAAVCLFALAHPSLAADKKDVLSACKNLGDKCGYSTAGNGDISGCVLGTKTCFYCPNDGKNQCIKVGQRVVTGTTPEIVGGKDDLLTQMSPTTGKLPKATQGTFQQVAPATTP